MQTFFDIRNFIYKKIFFLLEIFILFLVWLSYAGLIYLLLPFLGLSSSYTEAPLLFASFYLFLIGVVTYFIIPKFSYISEIDFGVTIRTMGLMVFSVMLILLYYALVYPSLLSTIELRDAYLYKNFLSGDTAYLFVKVFEIGLQQLLLFCLVKVLWNYNQSKSFVFWWVVTLFTLAHTLTIFVDGWYLAIVFLSGSIVAAKTFTYLILNHEDGFVYSYIAHWFLYVAFSVLLLVLINLKIILI